MKVDRCESVSQIDRQVTVIGRWRADLTGKLENGDVTWTCTKETLEGKSVGYTNSLVQFV